MPGRRSTTKGRAALLLACALAAASCAQSDDPNVAAGGDGGGGDAATTTVHEHGEHDHGDEGHHHDDACDVSVNPVAYYRDAELAGTLGAEHMDSGHVHGEEPADAEEEPNDMSGGLGEVDAAFLLNRLNEMDQAGYDQWLESLNPNRDVEAPDDTGMGGHLGPQSWIHDTDPAVCEALQEELDTAREVALRYPKASDAKAAGYFLVAPYLPGIASHWMNFRLVDGEFDVEQPEMLLYDGNGDDSNIVGLSYFIRHDGDDEPEVGFVSSNDHYHRHIGLCIKEDAGVIGDSTTTEEECEALGGFKSDNGSGWMSHAWVVPGCESPWGVFSAQNPLLDAPLGNASGQGEPCSGSEVAKRWDLSPASAEATPAE
jgi:hypothetical protein